MTEFPDLPQSDDAVLSDSKGDRRDLILGGIEGVKQCLSSEIETVRIEALSQASQYGREGLNLIIKAFREDTETVCRKAYKLLRDRNEPEVKKILQGHHTWQYCENLFVVDFPSLHRYSSVAISANGQVLARNGFTSDINWENRDIHRIHIPKPASWVEIWDLSTGRQIKTFDGLKEPLRLALTSDGKTLLTSENPEYGRLNKILQAWDITTGEEIFHDYGGSSLSMMLGADNETVAIGHYSSEWDWEGIEEGHVRITIVNLKNKEKVRGISWKPVVFHRYCSVGIHAESNIVLGSHDCANEIKAWDISERPVKELYTLKVPSPYAVRCFAVNPNGSSFASAIGTWYRFDKDATKSYPTIKNKSIILWKLKPDSNTWGFLELFLKNRDIIDYSFLQEQRCLGILEGHKANINALAFSPDGKILASGSDSPECSVKLWDLDSFQEICTLTQEDEPIEFIVFHQNKDIVYTATQNNVKAWGF